MQDPSLPQSGGTSTSAAKKFPDIVSVTSLGPWPGSDPVEAAKVGLGLLPEPHLPALASLPARGVGSDAVGRTAALLVELPVDVQPYGWRFVDRPGRDFRRAASALSTDINVLADVVGAGDLVPAGLKIHLTGPLSLAAAIRLHYGERALSDPGARRDIAQSLAAGLPGLVEKVQAAVPGTALTLQIDEPDMAAVLAGTIPTASGYRTLRAVPGSEVRQLWTALAAAARDAGFASTAINLARASAGGAARPATVSQAAGTAGSGTAGSGTAGSGTAGSGTAGSETAAAEAGVSETAAAEAGAWRKGLELALESCIDAIAVPLDLLHTGHWELLAGALESGLGLWAGTVPTRPGRVLPSYAALVERIMVPWRGLGLETTRLNQLRITPQGSLAPLSPREARSVLERSLETAEELTAIRYR